MEIMEISEKKNIGLKTIIHIVLCNDFYNVIVQYSR